MMVKTICILVILVSLFAISGYCADEGKRIIEPVKNTDEITPLEAAVWEKLYNVSGYDKGFCQTLYMWGFFDALTMYALECPDIQQLLSDYEGMNYEQVADTINKFYADHPSMKQYSPAVSTCIIIPEFKKRLPSLMEKLEKGEASKK
ncbi:MAG: hypothetical protein COS99_04720 [Candidatus Omnitrophica bacterium CG07_land_8_20_14_0_80_42_15]|uniref:Uncharacterized protein n=1 Tax=Candidatus Aquitaenariimonas noxiae TaxID=1974741 RepID=A0A2J0L2Y7_9BACT|nr:MAG: hypothetical protein COS99_04720 [Candidatus Omnitrophica bacterium CG07_land_8_20_14_0_80_42_15]